MRTYTKEVESPWQKAHSSATMGQEQPLLLRDMTPRERDTRIKAFIAAGLGDGSIAVRLNNAGFACTRAEVYRVRTGREAPKGHGAFEEMSIVAMRP